MIAVDLRGVKARNRSNYAVKPVVGQFGSGPLQEGTQTFSPFIRKKLYATRVMC